MSPFTTPLPLRAPATIATLVTALAAGAVGCNDNGIGTAKFTTWGEELIEVEIPAAEFTDGWRIKYDKFLVGFHAIRVANARGEIAATMGGSRLVDNVQPGRKALVTFHVVPAEAWDEVSYQIKAPVAGSELLGATEADRDLMVAGSYGVYVEGAATKDDVTKTFHWGFAIGTQYSHCAHSQEGSGRLGIVVTEGGTDTSELTTHGDHLFYDRLQSSPEEAVATSLRFDAMAEADTDADGEVTLAELDAQTLDVTRYNPSPFTVSTLGGFVTELAGTIGHFRGEGECSVSPITP